jgi:hypothetical protein
MTLINMVLGLSARPLICSYILTHNLMFDSVFTVRRLRKKWGLKSTRQQKHTFETIYEKVRDIRKRFPFRGAESIRKNMRELHGDHVPRYVNTGHYRKALTDSQRSHRRASQDSRERSR